MKRLTNASWYFKSARMGLLTTPPFLGIASSVGCWLFAVFGVGFSFSF
jgi:hypothetical protein